MHEGKFSIGTQNEPLHPKALHAKSGYVESLPATIQWLLTDLFSTVEIYLLIFLLNFGSICLESKHIVGVYKVNTWLDSICVIASLTVHLSANSLELSIKLLIIRIYPSHLPFQYQFDRTNFNII